MNTFDPESDRRRQALAQEVAELGEISPEDLFSLYSLNSIAKLDKAQREKSAVELATNPYTLEFMDAYPDSYLALARNTSTYEDDIEDAMIEDPIIRKIISARNASPDDRDMVVAFRVRRSVLMLSMLALKVSAEEDGGENGSPAPAA